MAKENKMIEIVVEGTAHEWPKNTEITFEEVVTLEYPDFASHPEITYSVGFHKAHGNKEGILSPGDSVKVKDGMVFNVSDTSQS